MALNQCFVKLSIFVTPYTVRAFLWFFFCKGLLTSRGVEEHGYMHAKLYLLFLIIKSSYIKGYTPAERPWCTWMATQGMALVMASIDDYRRPLDKVSTTQSATLAATGLIWTRYCLVIRPINYSLSFCNFMLGLANGVQCYRAYSFQRNMQAVP